MAASTGSLHKARILVVDDHPMVRDGLLRLISQQTDLVWCGEAGTVLETQIEVAKHKPDLVILDLRIKGGDGLELIKSLKAQFPALRILILSQYGAPIYVERALRAGALCIYTTDGPMCFQNWTACPAMTFTICLRIVRAIFGSLLSMGSTVFTSFPWSRIPGNKVCRIFPGEAC